jgi:hypothetical protein
MDAARKIREAVHSVTQLREVANQHPALAAAIGEIKQFQSLRFAATYADLLHDDLYAPAAQFFLDELYSDKDYGERDAQFARIASAIETLFPAQVTATATSLAQLHALTEDLDAAMGRAWLAVSGRSPAERYISCWREVGRRADRDRQLDVVLDVGRELARLVRTPGLRMMLRMMRGPASAAGLGSLQRFLETGFDTFAAMARRQGAAESFLRKVADREHLLIDRLFDGDPVACETELARALGQAR